MVHYHGYLLCVVCRVPGCAVAYFALLLGLFYAGAGFVDKGTRTCNGRGSGRHTVSCTFRRHLFVGCPGDYYPFRYLGP
uniref:Uncharacterized protein n=1 Tax=Anopheles darlingi TaxID=43151 RepID=A0A2M4DNQ1_ANODA